VYVEIESAEPHAISVAREGVCIAARFRPAHDEHAWRILESAPPASYFEPLVDWLALRLPHDGHFERRSALRVLERLASEDSIDTLGTVFGICGLLDSLGTAPVTGKSLSELARVFFRSTLSSAAKHGNEDANWLRRVGFDALLAIGRSLLTESDLAFHEPRSFEAWLELVPDEYQRGADLEWMKVSLALAKSPLEGRELEKAAQRVPPGAFRIIRTLQSVGFLCEAGADRLALAPHWFSHAIRLESCAGLVRLSPFEWGEALLRPSAAPGIAQQVFARVRRGQLSLDDVIDLPSDENPAQVAALECVFVSVGVALLLGAEIPVDQLEALWDEQMRLRIEVGSRVSRRIAHPTSEEPLLQEGIWLLAALSISEHLPEARGLPHATLRPWTLRAPSAGLRAVYGEIASSLAHLPDAELCPQAIALFDRLRASIGSLAQIDAQAHLLELPGIFLDEVEHAVPSWQTWQALATQDFALRASEWLASQRGIDWPRIAQAVLDAWQAAEYALPAHALFTSSWAAKVWPHASVNWLREWLPRAHSDQRRIAYDYLSPAQWDAIRDELTRDPLKSDAATWQKAPAALLELMFASSDDALDAIVVAVLWERDPSLALRVFDARCSELDVDAIGLLLAEAPALETEALVRVLEARVDPTHTPAAALDPLRAWLHGCVAQRKPAFREAYVYLASVERALMPLRPEAS
jgi:hypothetical protein